MCLITSQKKPVTAKKPIKCLKLVRKSVDADGNPKYRSYFSYGDVEYKIGETFIDTNPFTKSALHNIETGLHTFSAEHNGARTMYDWAVQRRDHFRKKEREPASLREKSFYRSCAHDVALLECQIPAGARYYKGRSNCIRYFEEKKLDQTGYVSDMLTPIRELTPDEIMQMPYVFVCYENR